VTGWVDYIQLGNIVVVSVILTNFGSHTHGSSIATGLPRPNRSYTTGTFHGAPDTFQLYLTDSGALLCHAFTSSGEIVRCAFAYMSI
jgi:hypothetical protein